MNMTGRYISFFVITIFVILLWMKFFSQPPPPVTEPATSEEAVESATTADQPDTIAVIDAEYEATTMAEAPLAVPIAEIPEPMLEAEEETTTLPNGLAIFEFSNIGAVLKNAVLVRDKVVLHNDVELFYGEMQPDEYPFSISSDDRRLNLAQYPFKLVPSENDKVLYTCEWQGLKVTKEYSISKDDYIVEVTITFENTTDGKAVFDGYTLGAGAMFPIRPIDSRPNYRYFLSGGGKPKKIKAKNGKAFTESFAARSWAGVMNRYFAVILKPMGQEGLGDTVTGGGKKIVGVDFTENAKESELHYYPLLLKMKPLKLQAHESITHAFSMYLGPNEHKRLKNLGYERIKTSWLSFIEIPMLRFLQWCYSIIPNYGIAIIVLTILVKILLYPLDQKSYKSMKEMQAIQPLIAELREKHKDDPRAVQQETMKLYKEHKVNPFGGCLPMLLQMPILFAMFKMLQNAVQLWGAHFTLWINDLSQPDSLIMFGQKIFMFDRLNVLPILMLASFYFQQKISAKSQTQDPQHKMMGTMMLVMFGFIFYNMPSGLNLYFTVSTVLRTVQQHMVQAKK